MMARRAAIRMEAGRQGRSLLEPGAPVASVGQTLGRPRRDSKAGVVFGDIASATSDATELIGLMARGDRSGLEGLYDRYAQLVFNLVIRIVW